jgi:phosphoglycolate phosphatase
MNPRYDPVVFDLDGTLVDSGPIIVKALLEACALTGVAVPESVDMTQCVGPPLEVILPKLLCPDVDVEALVSTYRRLYRPMAQRETVPMPGAVELLAELKEAGITLALATYKTTELASVVLDATSMREMFDVIGGRASPVDRRTKTQVLRGVLERLEPHGRDPLFVGDHQEDRDAAMALSVAFVPYVNQWSWQDVKTSVFGRSDRDDDRAHDDAQPGQNH